MRRVGFGHGLKAFGEGTLDAIINPQTIPDKIETCLDKAIVQPTLRTVDFIEESSHKVLAETDRAFNERVKKAQDGARHLKVVFAQPLTDVGNSTYSLKKYPKPASDRAVRAD